MFGPSLASVAGRLRLLLIDPFFCIILCGHLSSCFRKNIHPYVRNFGIDRTYQSILLHFSINIGQLCFLRTSLDVKNVQTLLLKDDFRGWYLDSIFNPLTTGQNAIVVLRINYKALALCVSWCNG